MSIMYIYNMIRQHKKLAAKKNPFYVRKHMFACHEFVWDMITEARKRTRETSNSAYVVNAIIERLKRDGIYDEYHKEFDKQFMQV